MRASPCRARLLAMAERPPPPAQLRNATTKAACQIRTRSRVASATRPVPRRQDQLSRVAGGRRKGADAIRGPMRRGCAHVRGVAHLRMSSRRGRRRRRDGGEPFERLLNGVGCDLVCVKVIRGLRFDGTTRDAIPYVDPLCGPWARPAKKQW